MNEVFLEKPSQLKAVNEFNTCIITAAGVIKIIIKDPLLSVLEEDANITHPAG